MLASDSRSWQRETRSASANLCIMHASPHNGPRKCGGHSHESNRMASFDKLRILVLKHLAKEPRAGYGLIKDIEEHTGWKPSYGSIYPLLDHLRQEGIVEFEEQGRKKIYHLTAQGKEELKTLLNKKEIVQHFREMERLMSSICSEKSEPFFNYVANSIDHGTIPFGKEVLRAGYDLRSELARIHQEGVDKKQKKRMIAILKEATKQLRELR